MYLLKLVHWVQTSKTLSKVRSKSNYRKWMPITTFCCISSHDAVCAACCANKTELNALWDKYSDSGATQQVRAIDLAQTVKSRRVPLHHWPEDNVSSLVSFPCLNQCKVSSDGLFHDVVPAVELFHLCTMTAHLKKKGVRNTSMTNTHNKASHKPRYISLQWLACPTVTFYNTCRLTSSLWRVLPFTYCIVLFANNGGYMHHALTLWWAWWHDHSRDDSTLTSLCSLAIAMLPSLLYLIGEPPSWISVP